MKDKVYIFGGVINEIDISNVAVNDFEVLGDMFYVGSRSSREIVECNNLIAACD